MGPKKESPHLLLATKMVFPKTVHELREEGTGSQCTLRIDCQFTLTNSAMCDLLVRTPIIPAAAFGYFANFVKSKDSSNARGMLILIHKIQRVIR